MLDRYNRMREIESSLLILISEIRADHPTISMRSMYYMLRPEGIGRDLFELFCKNNSLQSRQQRNWRRTTDSSGVIRFDNLLIGLTITKINQVWQSDITYFMIKENVYYITFIIDAYTRMIVGHQVSKRLLTEHTSLPALERAIKNRKSQILEGLIFHSDGGGQYYDKEFLGLTRQYKIVNSMCEYAWENGKAERINGIIKNNYLIHWAIKSYEDLVKGVDRAVQLYNEKKPHIKLNRQTPKEFETNILNAMS